MPRLASTSSLPLRCGCVAFPRFTSIARTEHAAIVRATGLCAYRESASVRADCQDVGSPGGGAGSVGGAGVGCSTVPGGGTVVGVCSICWTVAFFLASARSAAARSSSSNRLSLASGSIVWPERCVACSLRRRILSTAMAAATMRRESGSFLKSSGQMLSSICQAITSKAEARSPFLCSLKARAWGRLSAFAHWRKVRSGIPNCRAVREMAPGVSLPPLAASAARALARWSSV